MTTSFSLSKHGLTAWAADAAIGAYQRYLSPHKGFCCAYKAHTGKRSCSAYARAVVQKLGISALLFGLWIQFQRCKTAYANLKESSDEKRKNALKTEKKSSHSECCNPCDIAEMSINVADCAGVPLDCSI